MGRYIFDCLVAANVATTTMDALLLPSDVWLFAIAPFLTTNDRLSLSSTCRRMRGWFPPQISELPAEYGDRVRALLKKRKLRVEEVDAALAHTGSFLTGDIVLQAIVDREWEGQIDFVTSSRTWYNSSKERGHPLGQAILTTLSEEDREQPSGRTTNMLTVGEVVTNRNVRIGCAHPSISPYMTLMYDELIPRGIYREINCPRVHISGLEAPFPRFILSCCSCVYNGKYCYVSDCRILEGKTVVDIQNDDVFVIYRRKGFPSTMMDSNAKAIQKCIAKYESLGFEIINKNEIERIIAETRQLREG